MKMERSFIILLLVAFIVVMDLVPGGKGETLQSVSQGDVRYVEVVAGGEARIYPSHHLPLPTESGDRLDYSASGIPVKTTMPGGRRLLFGLAININSAGVSDLAALPGIGIHTARAITEYRHSFGKFESVSDLKRVKGIGEKRLLQIREYVTL